MVVSEKELTGAQRVAQLKEDLRKAREKSKEQGTPFWLILHEGERARIRLLLPLYDFVNLRIHEKYDRAANKFVVSAVCAAEFGKVCAHCESAKEDKSLVSKMRYFYPVYVHVVRKMNNSTGTWEVVTYKDENGDEQPRSGVRMLEMKEYKQGRVPILDELLAESDEDPDMDFTKQDFILGQQGSGLTKTYTLTRSSKALPLPDGLPTFTQDRVKSDIANQRGWSAVGETNEDEDEDDITATKGDITPDFDDMDE